MIAAAVLSLLAAPALAQMTQTTTTTTTSSPADQGQRREFVIHEHHPAVAPPADFDITTGAVLPQGVELYSFPAERHWNYEYTTFGDRTVLVDPATRKIVTIIR